MAALSLSSASFIIAKTLRLTMYLITGINLAQRRWHFIWRFDYRHPYIKSIAPLPMMHACNMIQVILNIIHTMLGLTVTISCITLMPSE